MACRSFTTRRANKLVTSTSPLRFFQNQAPPAADTRVKNAQWDRPDFSIALTPRQVELNREVFHVQRADHQ